jgi:hypothetical protein
MHAHELLSLWHGDALSDGYQSASLAAGFCEIVRPADEAALIARFYPQVPVTDIDEVAVQYLREGYHLWKERARSVKAA